MSDLVIGVFDDEEPFLKATRAARDEGLSIHDTYTPYAVHGLDDAMGLPRTRLPKVCFVLGLVGLVTALGFQLWASAWNWPLNIGGKSYAATLALIPITFEVTVLFAAIGTVIALFIRARLWPGRHEELLDPRVTDDRFVLALKPGDADDSAPRSFLESRGAIDVRNAEVTDE